MRDRRGPPRRRDDQGVLDVEREPLRWPPLEGSGRPDDLQRDREVADQGRRLARIRGGRIREEPRELLPRRLGIALLDPVHQRHRPPLDESRGRPGAGKSPGVDLPAGLSVEERHSPCRAAGPFSPGRREPERLVEGVFHQPASRRLGHAGAFRCSGQRQEDDEEGPPVRHGEIFARRRPSRGFAAARNRARIPALPPTPTIRSACESRPFASTPGRNQRIAR